MTTTKLHAGDPFPNLTALDNAGTTINISAPTGDADWRLLVVYRGRHCPLCTKFLNGLANYRKRLT
ncbi:MAG: thioredoxin peroxidase, partial [Pseudomonadota bacterium]